MRQTKLEVRHDLAVAMSYAVRPWRNRSWRTPGKGGHPTQFRNRLAIYHDSVLSWLVWHEFGERWGY